MTTLPRPELRIARVEAFVFRAPIATPVRTSFGTMHDRPALFVRVTDANGAHGWGEVWCNFPACGAEHRKNLIDTVLAPLLVALPHIDGPEAAFEHLSARSAVLAIQSGEHGPLAQAIAGIDLALWDLAARRAQQPLWRYLGGTGDRIAVYASGINPERPHETAARMLARGHRAFKLKIGFGSERDLANLRALRATLGDGHRVMVDANQAWTLAEALAMAPQLAPFALGWLEEPLRADRPWSEWKALRDECPVPLAGGENIAGAAQFDAAVAAEVFAVVQPDAAKWGGISGCWPVIAAVQRAGRTYCPHYLGGGVGLLASAHLLCAAGGAGMLEIDANPNPLRSTLCGPLASIDDGSARLGDAPGIGLVPDLAQLRDACRAAA
jgi:L-alanine-DL-glutamate epimerase-like enolase superfamily enzyme